MCLYCDCEPSREVSCGIFQVKSYVSNQILKHFGSRSLRLRIVQPLTHPHGMPSCWSSFWTLYPDQYRLISDPVHMAILQTQLKFFLGYILTIKPSLKSPVDPCQGNSDGGSNTNSAGFQPLKRAWWISLHKNSPSRWGGMLWYIWNLHFQGEDRHLFLPVIIWYLSN